MVFTQCIAIYHQGLAHNTFKRLQCKELPALAMVVHEVQ